MSAHSAQHNALRRRSNFFRGAGRETSTIIAQDHVREGNPLDARRASPLPDDAMTERDKLEVIERHIIAFAATLPAGSLSDANKQDIRSRAMRGGSSTSAIMTSVMQAVAVVKPTLQPQIANYYSSATSTEAGSLDGPRGIDGRPGSYSYAGAFGPSGARGGSGYLGRADYTSVAASSGNMSFVSNPTSVSMINYAGTPYAATGMTHSTFSYLRDDLRQERFSGRNILHSGQDARTNGFSPNDRVVAKAFAVLDRDDDARREPRNAQLQTFRDRMAGDAEIARLKAERDKATGEARAQLDAQLIERGQAISRETGTRSFLDAAPTEAARQQGRVIERKTIEQVTGANLGLNAQLGVDANRGLTETQQRQRAVTSLSPATPQGQPVLADAALRDRQRSADDVFGALAALDTPAAGQTGQQVPVTSLRADAATPTAPIATKVDVSDASKATEVPPAAAEARTTKTAGSPAISVTPPVQTAEAKPSAKLKSPGTSLSA